jgi:hypothetical protein
MKTIPSLVFLLCLLCAGCEEKSGKFVPRPHFRLFGTGVKEGKSAPANWVLLAAGGDFERVSYGQDAQTNTVIWFVLSDHTRIWRTLRDHVPDENIIHFRVMSGQEVVADFESYFFGMGGGVYIRTNREAAVHILKELKR